MRSEPSNNIKIGKTKNIHKRLKSLSGSNGAGGEITSLYCSPATYILSLESTCHNHYNYARIRETEWFRGEILEFKEVVEYVHNLFSTSSYIKCNELRKKNYERKNNYV